MNLNQPNPPGSNSPQNTTPPETPAAGRPVLIKVKMPGGKPWITYSLMGVTILVFILQLASQYLLGGDLPAYLGMKINELILQGQIWRLLTPVLLHDSSFNTNPSFFLHIAFNMYALYSFGKGMELFYGHTRFIILYLLGAISGNIASFYLSGNPSLGASTAVFALVAAESVFILRNRFLFGNNARSALINILTIVGINLFLGLRPGIDNWGHLGGLIGGFAFAWFAGPILKVEGLPPQLSIRDQQPFSQTWRVMITELGILILLVVLKFFLATL